MLKKQAEGQQRHIMSGGLDAGAKEGASGKDGGAKGSEGAGEDLARTRRERDEAVAAAEAAASDVKRAKAAERSMRSQAESQQLEYARLQEENEHLRTQLRDLDRQHAFSGGKKDD